MEKTWLIAGAILMLVVGFLIGGLTVPPEEVEVEVQIPGPTEVIEKPVEVVVEKEVLFENTTKIEFLEAELALLEEQFERMTDREWDREDAIEESEAIERAIRDFRDDYMFTLLWRDYTLSELSIDKISREEADVREVQRWVDGIRNDYDKVDVSFEIKAKYEDEDGVQFRWWEVNVDYDIDSEGREEITVDADLL